MDETNKKAPLASPVLTGKPTAPTAAQSSNDSQIATTAFVNNAVEPAIMWRGGLPATANLDNYGPTPAFTGIWNRSSNVNTTTAYGFPEDNGQGVLEVYPGGRYGGLQRYTVSVSGNVYVRSLNGVWNGTDGPWSGWTPAGIQTRTSFFTGDLNTLKTPGEWSVTTPFTNGPTDVAGICEVIPRLNGTGLIQRYTAIASGAANINRTWQRTLSGGTWSEWDPVGVKPVNDLGMGLSAVPTLSSFDWQQFDMSSGAIYRVAADNIVNMPSGIAFASGTGVFIKIDGTSANGTRFSVEVIPDTALDANYRAFKVLGVGTKGMRVFSVRQVFTSADVIPLASGGLGANTPEGGRKALGFDDVGIGIQIPNNSFNLDWQTYDFVTGENKYINTRRWTNAPDFNNLIPGALVYLNCQMALVANAGVVLVTDENRRMWLVKYSGAKGSRVFSVSQIYTDSTTVKVENGGTGATTADGAVNNLGLRSTVDKAAKAVSRDGDEMRGPLKTTANDTFRIKAGNRAIFSRFDGSNFYFMLTNPGDPDGTWNGLRPFTINAANGVVTLAGESNCNGAFRAGALVSADLVYAGNGTAYLQSDGNVYGGAWGGHLSTWLNNRFATKSTAGLGQNGWERDASTGRIRQWGYTNQTTGFQYVTFPIPFPNQMSNIQVTPYTPGSTGTLECSCSEVSNTGAKLTANQPWPLFWEATGF
ncbi:gp53-like domain-containing protein [Atlantibacter hermannii]|uniref:pyocin knob domain-containing protein n=1 Tax=Atlantibacter hermannii TaxID=565 RepID=UPI00307607AB